ncbi:Undecaprenyl phosphate-alpha-4-amino-4-deoxy-L-arabinose arabinosyl transferase [Tritonibacter multivorans]|uniref:Undecaprenyl phosphate-alpha-4-amino-4-deoxy-L-arabinose arabinosyl transferase n=1 Tax=Tritonibacter multivorans TaxID=928856 RepID=A0A0P1G203_9RHOB|nr:glycosyltransferase family 39 protein [Tritonibacter multivorans]MDA7419513.1 glycosyltransferase family 39 protein [Tritonibacter multivorans]CUH75613.1 Undecaprenyl phosphate-alpha-4-amino-4-deoxy-L-arabinose arabinosyl transferase [Tritonibacter multivorans]SFC64285.1 4-amino-4-deoxy-L-arabinose transferase [Tritonibacter multivorans]
MQKFDALLTRLSNGPRAWVMLFLVLLTLLMSLPGFFDLPPIDRDETRFSQASRQMVETGDFIDIRLGEGTRYKKPIGIYWLQSASLSLLGPEHLHDIWAYRLPSALSAVVAVLLTYLITLTLMGAPQALGAAVMLASCFVFGAETRLAKTDMTLLATILACQYVLARLWLDRMLRAGLAYGFWAALAVSVLIKGPIGLLVVGSTALVLCAQQRSLRWLAPLRAGRGMLLLLALVLPWYIAITIKSDGAFWVESLGKDLLAKIGEGQESHGAPPGFYLGLVWVTFWPASILLPFGIWFAFRQWRAPEVIFCLAWIIPTWLLFEFTATKLIHYVLPTYPALAALCAAGWMARPKAPLHWTMKTCVAALLVLGTVFPVASVWFGHQMGVSPTRYWIFGVALSLAGAVLMWRTIGRGRVLAPVLALALLSLGMTSSLWSHLARAPALWPSVALSQKIRSADLCTAPLVLSVGYQEESLMLLSPHPVTFDHNAASAVERLSRADCALVFVDAPKRAAFDNAATEIGRDLTPVGQVTGFAIGGGDEVALTLYEMR